MFTHRDVLGKDGQLHATVTVTTFGPDFLHGAEGEYMLEDFPESGQSVVALLREPLDGKIHHVQDHPDGTGEDLPQEPQHAQDKNKDEKVHCVEWISSRHGKRQLR